MITIGLYSVAKLEASCGSDPVFIREIIEMSCAQMTELSGLIIKSAEKENWPDVYFHAHKLKASIGLLEINLMEEIKSVTVNARHETNTETILPQVKSIVAVVAECVEQMKKDFLLR